MGILLRRSKHRDLLFPLLLGGMIGLVLLLVLFWRESPSSNDIPLHRLDLSLSKKAMGKLRAVRRRALQEQVLIVRPGDWVKGRLRAEGREHRIRLRLKGDWTDHLQSGKWSFRVQLRDSAALWGTDVFSLQSPRTRSFLQEWYLHEVLRKEGVPAPRYRFVRLRLNDIDLGIYAWEEHFTRYLVESMGYREGPLLRWNEAGMWDLRHEALVNPQLPYQQMPFYESAEVAPFQWKRLRNRPEQRAAFDLSHTLLHQYKHGLRPVSEVFDLEVAARQYALLDLFGGHHAHVWHNRRFYMDPVSLRMLPVVYDAFPGEMGPVRFDKPFLGFGRNGQTFLEGHFDQLDNGFMADSAFLHLYFTELRRVSSPEYLEELDSLYGERLDFLEKCLRQEFWFYAHDRNRLPEQARKIREGLVWAVEKVVWDSAGGSWCLNNYNPVPLWVWEGEKPLRWLPAWDGRQPAAGLEWTQPPQAVRVGVPGGPLRKLEFN